MIGCETRGNSVSPTTIRSVDRDVLRSWYQRNRERSAEIFAMLTEEAYYTRPIKLRNPVVFYEGHLPAFSINVLLKKGLGLPPIDERLESLFARGIDPEDENSADGLQPMAWPSRDVVQDFASRADRAILDAIEHAPIDQPGHPVLDRAAGVYTILEHEAMHHETLLYMWHRLPFALKQKPELTRVARGDEPPKPHMVEVSGGRVTLGADSDELPFGWDNELPQRMTSVEPFAIDAYNVTNREYLELVDAGGYRDRSLWSDEGWAWREAENVTHPIFWEREGGQWFWRGQFDRVPLPLAWPVYVSHAEASAYARWKGMRLPTEAEFHRAAFGTPSGSERPFPWGDAAPDESRGNFDFAHWDPVPVGSYPSGVSAWGVHDLIGNGWEWTNTIFDRHPGFRTTAYYPEYSADFFDGHHYVMKGAAPVTPRELVRASFRNWFRATYPYVYASFRCVANR